MGADGSSTVRAEKLRLAGRCEQALGGVSRALTTRMMTAWIENNQGR